MPAASKPKSKIYPLSLSVRVRALGPKMGLKWPYFAKMTPPQNDPPFAPRKDPQTPPRIRKYRVIAKKNLDKATAGSS
jgi:hypothetical protein